MKLTCECQAACQTEFEIAPEDYNWLILNGAADIILIAADCTHGPEPGDTWIENKGTYKIYRAGLPFSKMLKKNF